MRAGLALGAAAAAWSTRLLQNQLFDVSAQDPATYIGAIGLLLSTILAASYFPARMALSVEPAESLRLD